MTALERLAAAGILVLILLLGGAWWVHHYGAEQYKAGQAAAVAAGEKLRQAEAERNREAESYLRTQLATKDAAAFNKEREYAANLEDAQRRVRAGTDRLRCPASPVPAGAASGDRPAAGGPVADAEGPGIVPEVASDLLGIAGDVAGLVRKFDRLNERFEACRAVNSK